MLENKGQIDHSIPVPLYFQLKELILGEIRKGNYKPGDALPTEKELSEMFGLSRTTVRQASAELVREGWVVKVKSRGTFVGHPKITQDFMKKLESFDASIKEQGMKPSTQVRQIRIVRAQEIPQKAQEALGFFRKEEIIYLDRLRMADEIPVLREETYLPFESCAHIQTHNFEQERLFTVLGEKPETRVYRVEREVEAVEAGAEDAALLDYKKGKPVLSAWSTAYNEVGQVILISFARYRGDYSRFMVTVLPDEMGQKDKT